jgi:hypothetical protein
VTFEDYKLLPSASHVPTLEKACWTPSRVELHVWLQHNAPSLAELYEGAVRLTYESPLPGQVRFISHAVREIRNRLPDVISGTKGGGQLQYKNRLDDLVKAWQNAGFSLDGSIPTSIASTEPATLPSPDVTFPRPLFLQIATLIKDHETTRTKPEDAAIRLFEACAPENQQLRDTLRPVVLQWLEVTDWFMRRAHDSGKVDADCDGNEFRRQFELFELALGALVRGFFATVEGLDEILEDANS